MLRTECDVRILVADDNDLMRNGLRSRLESQPGRLVCGEAIDGKDAVKQAIKLRPDVILLDISMPRLNGFEAAKCIHEQVPLAEILIITEHDSQTLVHMPVPPGVRGYVMKSQLDRDLLSAVEAASNHRNFTPSATAC